MPAFNVHSCDCWLSLSLRSHITPHLILCIRLRSIGVHWGECLPYECPARALHTTFIMTFPDLVPKFTITQ